VLATEAGRGPRGEVHAVGGGAGGGCGDAGSARWWRMASSCRPRWSYSRRRAWRSNAPQEPQNAPDCIKSVTTELDALTRYTNIVILEGPTHVSLAAQELQARLTLESVNIVKAAKESPGKAPCLHDEKLFTSLHIERAKTKTAFIKSAQVAIAGRTEQTRSPASRCCQTKTRTAPVSAAGVQSVIRLRIFVEYRGVVDRARPVLIRIRWVCGGRAPPYLRENRTLRGASWARMSWTLVARGVLTRPRRAVSGRTRRTFRWPIRLV